MIVPQVVLEPWGDQDYELLVRTNAPEMMEHLGGPESPEQLEKRHRRYLDAKDLDSTFVHRVTLQSNGAGVGTVAVWEREWGGETVYEIGWSILPEYQGRGFASAAARLAIAAARETGRCSAVHAFPSVENAASNGICRRLGFTLLGAVDFEYPKGHWMRCHNWRLELVSSSVSQ